MRQIILLFALLTFSLSLFAEGNFATNSPDVFVKNFICSGGKATFNLVNKSSRSVRYVNLNIFDSAGDPIDQKYTPTYVEPNSGKEIYINVDCNKAQRVGFSIQFN